MFVSLIVKYIETWPEKLIFKLKFRLSEEKKVLCMGSQRPINH